ncbi:MAG TPA: DUF998 domain-containing protein [Candidatus Saccharimonadales bacterium]|nr:DUF998 domain-containing protein [Candidatus Saccharimonadales bacterium]
MPKLSITTKPLSPLAINLARVSAASAALFLVLFALLHVLKPEIDPSWRFISEYQLGQYGWMMHLAFWSLAVSSASLWFAVKSQIRTIGGYIGLFFLFVATIGFVLAAANTTDPITATVGTDAGRIHSTGALLASNVTGAIFFLSWSLARNKGWAKIRTSLWWVAAIGILTNLASFWMQGIMAQHQNVFGPDTPIGLPNHLLIIGLAGCLLVMASRIITAPKHQ